LYGFPPYLSYVATLPCEIQKVKTKIAWEKAQSVACAA